MNKYFGTDGIRATFENSFLDEDFAFSLGKALALFIQKMKSKKGKFLSVEIPALLAIFSYMPSNRD